MIPTDNEISDTPLNTARSPSNSHEPINIYRKANDQASSNDESDSRNDYTYFVACQSWRVH